jgi:hypothetical protein
MMTALVYRAFVTSWAWAWFMVPFGMVELNTITVMGLMYTYTIFSGASVQDYLIGKQLEKMSNLEKCTMYVVLIIATTMLFGMAWLIHMLQGAIQ